MKNIGVIGLGIMGGPMALNLLKAGFRVSVHNRTASKCEPLRLAGASVASSIAELVEKNDVILLMLADDSAVREIIAGNAGIAAAGRPGQIIIDSSTINPATSREMAAALNTKKITYLDAPVTGSKKQAQEKQLLFLVGGDEQACRQCSAIFDAMGRRQVYLGGSGMGTAAKIGNNMMCAANLAAFAEAMVVVKKFGLDPTKFFDVICNSGGRSGMAEGKGPRILADDYANPDFALPLMHKDAAIGIALAQQVHVQTPVIAAAKESFRQASQSLPHDLDFAAIYRWYEQRNV